MLLRKSQEEKIHMCKWNCAAQTCVVPGCTVPKIAKANQKRSILVITPNFQGRP